MLSERRRAFAVVAQRRASAANLLFARVERRKPPRAPPAPCLTTARAPTPSRRPTDRRRRARSRKTASRPARRRALSPSSRAPRGPRQRADGLSSTDADRPAASALSLSLVRSAAVSDSPPSSDSGESGKPDGWDELEAISTAGRMLEPLPQTSATTLASLEQGRADGRLPPTIQDWHDSGPPNEVAAAVYSDSFAFWRKLGMDEACAHLEGALALRWSYSAHSHHRRLGSGQMGRRGRSCRRRGAPACGIGRGVV